MQSVRNVKHFAVGVGIAVRLLIGCFFSFVYIAKVSVSLFRLVPVSVACLVHHPIESRITGVVHI